MNEDEEIIFNVAIVGDSNVGKTCLIKKLLDKNFDLNKNKQSASMGVSQYIYKTSINGKRMKIIFSDTAGDEKYHSVMWTPIKRACAFLIVFDLTDEVSFDNIIFWKDQIKENVDISKVDLIMVANKCDLERKVDRGRIDNFEKKNKLGTNYMFYETSALTGEGIDECLEGLINKITYKYEHLENKKDINKNIILKNNNERYMNDEEKIIFKVAVIGDECVGKTCLIKKILDKNFDLNKNIIRSTLGTESYIYQTSKNGKRINIIFLDTNGSEKYYPIRWPFIKIACAFLIVFDLTDEVSFDNIIFWKDQIKENVDISKVDLIMVANKCDLERKVDRGRIDNFEKKNKLGTNYMFYETSALTGEGIDECLEGLINKITYKYEHLEKKNKININLNEKKHYKNSSCCYLI